MTKAAGMGAPACDEAAAADAPAWGGYVVEAQAGFLLRRAHQRHAALFQDMMGARDLTPTQFTALIKIVTCGAVTQNRLGRLAAMDPATIQGVVRRLVARGLVTRDFDPADRRTHVLRATLAGLEVARQAVACATEITAATLAPLSPTERPLFLSLLKKLI
ncbi:MAG: MarR family winged helix-turn-helix transcriptional regulator [Acidibrevibacterium sp.]|uniref:MarR family winged helix-turn-helix transcriptional regulator n=1 Tax=Acidibrevibacterium sp. TaxID=2606776 RepID=UPI003D017CCC